MKISFILPVYKVEAYLRECVESLTCQTYKDFEIILVDDGSPDGCPELCDEWAKKDARIKVLHKPNGGLSDARNAGLKIATGDYVIFVDSDDFWVNNGALERLIKYITNTAKQFVCFNAMYYYSDKNEYKKWNPYNCIEGLSKDEILLALHNTGTMPVSACTKIILRKFLIENNLYFIKGQIHEDIPWFINLIDKAENFSFYDDYIYAYRQNVTTSLTRTISQKNLLCAFDIIKTEVQKASYRKFNEIGHKALMSFLAYEYMLLLCREHLIEDPKIRKELKEYRWLLQYDLNPKVHKANLFRKIFGYRMMEFVLRKSMELRNR